MFGKPPTQDLVYVMNVYIHEEAKLSRKEFLERVSGVVAIRANWVTQGITWYPTTATNWNFLPHLHAAIRSGDFAYVGSRPDYKYFGLFLARPQYAWLANNDLGVLQRQVVGFLAGMYAHDAEAEKFMSQQLYPPIYEEMKTTASKYFSDAERSKLDRDDFTDYYVEQFKEYTGGAPPSFLQYPSREVDDVVARTWGCDMEFYLGYGEFYMSGTDWKTVVEEGKDDALIRSESETGLWQRWKQTFELADSGGSHVFEIFASPSSKGCIYIIQQGDSDLYKIGWTADTEPSRRVAALQTASPENLSVVGSFSASSRQTEATLHRLFSQFKQRGEWFRLNVEQVSHMLDERWRSNQQIF